MIANGKVIGYLGQVAEEVIGKMRNQYPIFMAFIDADKLLAVNPKKSIYSDLPTTPATSRDISFLADSSLTHAEVLGAVKAAKVKMLEKR